MVPFDFNLFLYIFLIRGGGCHWQGTASGPKSHIGRSKKSHWQGRKSHTRAKMSHWSVIIEGLRPALEGFVVTMQEGACETGSQILRVRGRGISRTVLMCGTEL